MTRHTTSSPDRRGFALAVAIFAIIVIGAIVAGVFFTSLQQFRLGRNTATQARALTAAEYGQNTLYSQWDQEWNSLPVGTTIVRAHAAGDGSRDTVRLTKVTATSFLVVSEGFSGAGLQDGARRRTAMQLTLDVPSMRILGALTSRGTVRIGGSTNIIGRDTTYPGWDCPPAGAAVAGAAVPLTSNISVGGTCSGYACLQGSPLVSITPVAADTNTYFDYGNQEWDDLVARADKTVSGTMTGVQPTLEVSGECRKTDTGNWGDPRRLVPAGACQKYFPIIYAPGNLTVNGNMGQGTLLVNGNLSIQGGFEFFGPVISRGTVKLTGTGNKINGAVMAASIIDSTSTSMLSGNSTIRYSNCALQSALRMGATPLPTKQRSWAELF